MATTSISLVREHSEYMKPPRALWVPFYLGRPFGVPDDPDFQRDVLRAALDLLPTLTEHGIVDYPVEAPEDSFSHTWACPVSFVASDADSLGARLRGEAQRLAPWWRETHRARGRTLVGASAPVPDGPDREVTVPQHVDTLAAALVNVAEGAPLDTPPAIEEPAGSNPAEAATEIAWSHPMPFLLRHLVQDLRCFYQEAAAGQPGARAPSHRALNEWIFGETVLGEAIIEMGRRLTEAGDPRLRTLRFWSIPEGFWPDGDAVVAAAPGTDPFALADQANKLFAPRAWRPQ